MRPLAMIVAIALASAAAAAEPDKDGFVPMFNGKDLSGWVNVNTHPGTFFVKDGMIITTGKPTGYLRTDKQYENFIAEFDWMHIPNKPGEVGNSGFFVWADPIPAVGTGYTRGIEVQVLVNLTYKNKKGEITATSQGDLFSIWGATCVPDRPHPDGWARCLPKEDHCKGEKEWNHYRVEAKDGRLTLAVNGHEVSGVSKCNPRKGYLALESEGSECRFKNLKIKELPSTNPKPEEVADLDMGFRNFYLGDLSGWKAGNEVKEHWKPADWRLVYDGKGKALRTEKEFGDAEFIADVRFHEAKGKKSLPGCRFEFREGVDMNLPSMAGYPITLSAPRPKGGETRVDPLKELKPAGQWNRVLATLKGNSLAVSVNGKPAGEIDITGAAAKGTFSIEPSHGEVDFANIFVRELK